MAGNEQCYSPSTVVWEGTLSSSVITDVPQHRVRLRAICTTACAKFTQRHRAQRVLTKTTRRRQPSDSLAEIASPRESVTNCPTAVRGFFLFFLDIVQSAMDNPPGGPWARWTQRRRAGLAEDHETLPHTGLCSVFKQALGEL
jgi:hypothetical protein